MTKTAAKTKQADKAIQRLFSAVDRTIKAADAAKKARDEIIRLSADFAGVKQAEAAGDE